MDHVRFGRTGLQVSRLCLGTMTFGLQCDEAQSRAVLDAAATGGIGFLDSADVYPLGGDRTTIGRTEEILGAWLKAKRTQFIIATKCFGATGPKPWDAGMSRRHVLEAIDASLRRLGTDHIDLYQLHGYDRQTPLDEALEALDTVVRQGKPGMSACRTGRVQGRAGPGAHRDQEPRPHRLRSASLQPAVPNLRARSSPPLRGRADRRHSVQPLAGGFLTGKHDRSAPPPDGSRFTLGWAGPLYQARYWHEREFDTVAALGGVARQAGLSMATLAVRWVLSNPAITAPIIGASRPEQLADSLAAAEAGPLPPDLRRHSTNSLSATGWPRTRSLLRAPFADQTLSLPGVFRGLRGERVRARDHAEVAVAGVAGCATCPGGGFVMAPR